MESEYKVIASKRITRSVSQEPVSVWQEAEIRKMIREEIDIWSGDAECPSMDINAKDADSSLTSTGSSKIPAEKQNVPIAEQKSKKPYPVPPLKQTPVSSQQGV